MQLKIAALSLALLVGCATEPTPVAFTPPTTIEGARILGDFGPRLGFNAPADDLNASFDVGDGVHLNADGLRCMALIAETGL